MRSRSVTVLLLLPLLALAQDKVQITPKWEKGQKIKQTFEMTLTLATVEAKVSGIMLSEVLEAAADKTTISFKYDPLKVMLNDEEQSVPFDPCKITLGKDQSVTFVDGGLQGADQTRIFLAGHFVPPAKEVAVNDTWTSTVPKNESTGVGEISYEGKYLGPEKIGDASAHKFQIKMTEKGNDFSVETTVWSDTAASPLKIEGKFKNMPVPVASDVANGSFKIEKSK